MTTIMINANLGVHIDNMPEEIFQAMRGDLGQCNDGGPKFQIDDSDRERVVDRIRVFAMDNGVNVEVNDVGMNVVTMKRRVEAQVETPDERVTQPVEGVTQANRPIDGTPVAPVREETNDLAEQLDDPREEEDLEEDHIEEPSMVGPSIEEDGAVELDQTAAREMMCIEMENEMTSLAKALKQKQDEFDLLWTRLLGMKRELDAATAPIEGNPIISEIETQAEELRRADNAVESLKFKKNPITNEGFIEIKTKELITDNEIEGAKRLIGRMKIILKMKPLVGSASKASRPVVIRNMDHRFNDGSEIWECGHVPSNSSMCWGTAWEHLFSAMASRDLPSIVEVIIRFIRNPNTADSYGYHVRYWPESDQQEG